MDSEELFAFPNLCLKVLQADGRNKANYKNCKVNLQLPRNLQNRNITQYYLKKGKKKTVVEWIYFFSPLVVEECKSCLPPPPPPKKNHLREKSQLFNVLSHA